MDAPLLCPSARGRDPDALLIGAVVGDEEMRVHFLKQAIPAREIDLEGPEGDLSAALRFAAPCAEAKCSHFAEGGCSLGARIVEGLPKRKELLAFCPIRKRCRWFAEQGLSACSVCPSVASTIVSPSRLLVGIATPPSPCE